MAVPDKLPNHIEQALSRADPGEHLRDLVASHMHACEEVKSAAETSSTVSIEHLLAIDPEYGQAIAELDVTLVEAAGVLHALFLAKERVQARRVAFVAENQDILSLTDGLFTPEDFNPRK